MEHKPKFSLIGCWVLGPGVAIRMNTVAFITYDRYAAVPHIQLVTELGKVLRICGDNELQWDSRDEMVVVVPGFTHDAAKEMLDIVKLYMSNR